MSVRAPTSALLERVEKHIDRLDTVLKDSEDLLAAIQRGEREDWIRELQNRLDAYAAETAEQSRPAGPPGDHITA